MRRFTQGGALGPYVAGDVNIVNITNVTNVTNVSYTRQPRIQRRQWERGRREDRPRLLRFCASGGLLDRDVAYGMDEGEMMTEASKLASHGFKGMASSLRGVGNGIIGMLRSIFD